LKTWNGCAWGSRRNEPDDHINHQLDRRPRRVAEYKGIVTGEAILGTNIFRDIFCRHSRYRWRTFGAYEKALREAREIALAEMQDEAARPGRQLPLSASISIMKISPQVAIPRC
jgi:hypothetical protein